MAARDGRRHQDERGDDDGESVAGFHKRHHSRNRRGRPAAVTLLSTFPGLMGMPMKVAFNCPGAVAAMLSLGAAFVTAGAQEPIFKAGNRTVPVYATVKNSDGRLVPDLDRTAFSVFDEGKRQELTVFANEIQPITVVMLLDRSGSMRHNFELVEQAAEKFVE